MTRILLTLEWRHNGRDSVSNHQPHDCLLNRLFRRRSKKTSKLRVTGLCTGNSPETGEFPAQMASNAENVSIWWRHHEKTNPLITKKLGGWRPSELILFIVYNAIRNMFQCTLESRSRQHAVAADGPCSVYLVSRHQQLTNYTQGWWKIRIYKS